MFRHVISAIAVFCIIGHFSTANAVITVDGDLSDWGVVSIADGTAGDPTPSDFGVGGGLIALAVEDQDDTAGDGGLCRGRGVEGKGNAVILGVAVHIDGGKGELVGAVGRGPEGGPDGELIVGGLGGGRDDLLVGIG